jgi:integrase
MQFTDKYIKNLKSKEKQYDLRENSGQGFGIRIMPSGHKSWIFIYHFNGKKQRMTLGVYPAISLYKARELHRNAIRCLAHGDNPALLQRQSKIEARLADTVNDLINEFLEKWSKARKRSWKEDERILKKEIAPILGRLKAKDITRRDIIRILDGIVDRGAPIAANRTLAVVRRMFGFAVERSIIEISPCYGVKAPTKENRRDRVLSEDEIKAFWYGLDNASMFEISKLALKLQLVTAQRKGEVISAEWEEFDFKNGWWVIPAFKAKNGFSHRVPLSKLAIEIVEELKKYSGDSIWLFPSPKDNKHILASAIDRALRKNIKKFENLKHATPHDLRRTAASYMTSLGISRLVVSKILNHVESSVTAIYDRHSYDKEKKVALDKWEEKIKEIIYS